MDKRIKKAKDIISNEALIMLEFFKDFSMLFSKLSKIIRNRFIKQ
jgi:hypothetical protein